MYHQPKFTNFANDVQIACVSDYSCFSLLQRAVSTINDELNSTDEWVIINGLTLNPKKSDAIFFFKNLMLLLVT